MTAPERIAMRWEPGAAVTNGPLMTHPEYTQYTRADLVEAMVAEAVAKERLIGLNVEAAKEDGRTIARLMSELAEARAAAVAHKGNADDNYAKLIAALEEADRLRDAVAKERERCAKECGFRL